MERLEDSVETIRTWSHRARRHWRAVAATLLASGLLYGGKAAAGARPYAFVYGAETLPETGLELENWFGDSRDGTKPASWNWWMGPVLGVTDHIELAGYAIFDQAPAGKGPVAIDLDSFRLQGSWLLADRGSWPVDVNLRLEVGVPAASQQVTTWFTVIVAREISRLDITANASGWLEINKIDGDVDPYLTYRLGSSFQIIPGIRVGAEFVGSTDFDDSITSSFTAGPSVALGYGRLWASANYGFGFGDNGSSRARVIVGLAF